MRPKAILFDLDGTLLTMDQAVFMKHYFGEMAKVLAPLGIAPEAVAPTIWAGTKAMMKNTGETTNDTVFWQVFAQVSGLDAAPFRPAADQFYTNQFHRAKAATGENPLAAEAVRIAREKAELVVLATNPLFPMVGQRSRLSWIGLTPEDFDLVTAYETDCFCKPNPAYFLDVCRRIGVEPEQCVMIGNDETEDMAAATAAGIKTCFLITDCRIAGEAGWDGPQGTFSQMLDWLRAL